MSRYMTKPTKWVGAQRRHWSAWASAQSYQSLRCPHEETWALSYLLNAQRRHWSDWADGQADLSLRWVHNHFSVFFMLQFKCKYFNIGSACYHRQYYKTSKKLRGHTGLGQCTHPLLFAYGQEWLEIGSWNLIHGISMKNKQSHIFFAFLSDLSFQSYVPFWLFFDFCK